MSEVKEMAAATNGKKKATAAEPKVREPKDVRFRKLAIKRVPNAIKRIRQVANLANRVQYEYTPAQAEKIVSALAVEMDRLEMAFQGIKPAEAAFEL